MSKVAIIDFGSQFTQLIARRIREMNVYSEIFSSEVNFDAIKDFQAFIFSGGPGSINSSAEIPRIVIDVIEFNNESKVPILGICYGLQLIGNYFNVSVISKHNKEFGRMKLKVIKNSAIIDGVWNLNSEVDVWMSHSDSLSRAPQGFEVIASSKISDTVAIIANENRKIYATQFHPEVSHTEKGKDILSNFLKIANCNRDWSISSFLTEQQNVIKETVGDKKVIAAVSGGVDSSVAAALLHSAIGDQLHCIFIDTGLLRKNERDSVKKLFVDKFHIPITFIDKSELFLSRIKSITDPEEKRKIIGKTFIEVFEKEALKIKDVEFLMQGTLYPDIIESGSISSSKSAKIKSHHNVGGLPDKMHLKLIEPLKYLFKDEVRLLGKELGISNEIVMRHPFPGPGLAVRIIGEITEDRIKILQEVDDIYVNTLKSYNLYNLIWQAFAVLLPVKTVGVMGDDRTYEYVCALRAVTSSDGMTADCFPFESKQRDSLVFWDFLQNVSNIIINKVQGVNRVVYDITSKPPSTIEWE